MLFVRIHWKRLGEHVHCRIFTGKPYSTYALSGEMTVAFDEWPDMALWLVASGKDVKVDLIDDTIDDTPADAARA